MSFRYVSLVMCAGALLSASSKASEPISNPLTCDFSNETSPLVVAEITNLDIEGAVLEFPQDYVFSLPFKSGELRDALLLRADINDFSSYPKEKQYLEDGTYKQQVGIRDWMTILVGSHVPMHVMWKRRLISSYSDVSSRNYKEVDVKLELTDIGLMTPKKPSDTFMRTRNVYVNKHDTDVRDIITCTKVGLFPNSSCDHVFETGAYDVKISYRRSELPRWKKLRDGVSNLLQCFTIKEPIELPDVKVKGD